MAHAEMELDCENDLLWADTKRVLQPLNSFSGFFMHDTMEALRKLVEYRFPYLTVSPLSISCSFLVYFALGRGSPRLLISRGDEGYEARLYVHDKAHVCPTCLACGYHADNAEELCEMIHVGDDCYECYAQESDLEDIISYIRETPT